MARKDYLQAMGIPVWKPRRHLPLAKQVAQVDVINLENDTSNEQVFQESDLDWDVLRQQVTQCVACDLYQSRHNAVFGVGSKEADLMVITEAPNEEEDNNSEPFVGEVGLLLDQMLFAIGMSRREVFLSHIVKCRTPDKRDPHPEEISRCENFLAHQIQIIKPKVILTTGRIASQYLFQSKETISQLRGNISCFPKTNIPMIATYHPAYLMRSPTEKRKVWSDLVCVKKALEDRL
jgi:DNA polymerase